LGRILAGVLRCAQDDTKNKSRCKGKGNYPTLRQKRRKGRAPGNYPTQAKGRLEWGTRPGAAEAGDLGWCTWGESWRGSFAALRMTRKTRAGAKAKATAPPSAKRGGRAGHPATAPPSAKRGGRVGHPAKSTTPLKPKEGLNGAPGVLSSMLKGEQQKAASRSPPR
jgi:hypothetical protein